MPRLVTFIYPIIRNDFIEVAVKKLAEHTNREKFHLIIVDQSIEGISAELKKYLYDNDDLYIRMRNAGFSKASNEGIIHALKWQTPYITVCNDDTEPMYSGWFEDAIEEFKTDPQILAVCPESPRVAMWGYGLQNGEMVELVPHRDNYSEADIAYLKSGDYDENEIRARHAFEIPTTFPFTKRGIVDGIAMWMPIFKREAFIELGLFEERFIWGGGEDYDMLARAYSCGYPIARDVCDPKYHRRMVSTMRSWVWHWWGQSKDVKATLSPELFGHKQPWNNLGQLWGLHFDVWGHYTDKDGVKRPITRKLPVSSI